MMLKLLKSSRLFLRRHPWVKQAVSYTGINKRGRAFYEKSILHTGTINVTHFGQKLTFSVSSLTELKRIESLMSEAAFIQRMIDSIQPHDVFFDVGANVGLMSLLVCSAGGKGISVRAFEPEPRNAEALRRNIELNRFADRILVEEIALADHAGTATLHVTGDVGDGKHSLKSQSEGNWEAVIIKTITMDAFAARSNVSPAMVKIDVEGAEMQVLHGMEELLSRQAIRDLFIEIHPTRLDSGVNEESLHTWLQGHGYHRAWHQKRHEEIHSHYSVHKSAGAM